MVRRHGHSAHHRLRRLRRRSPRRSAPSSSPTSRTSPGSSPAARIRRRCAHADVISTTTHKTLRGPRGGMLMCKAQHAGAIDKAVFPGLQGGPHNQTTAGIAVALKEASTDDVQEVRARRSSRTPRRWPTALIGARLRPRLGRHRQPPHPRRPDQQGGAGQEGGAGARPRRPRAQLQHGALRSAQAVRSVGHPPRHAGGHRRAAWAPAEMKQIAGWLDRGVQAARSGDEARAREDLRRGSRARREDSRRPDCNHMHDAPSGRDGRRSLEQAGQAARRGARHARRWRSRRRRCAGRQPRGGGAAHVRARRSQGAGALAGALQGAAGGVVRRGGGDRRRRDGHVRRAARPARRRRRRGVRRLLRLAPAARRACCTRRRCCWCTISSTRPRRSCARC